MSFYVRYQKLKKPAWAPPPWLFGPVWTVLYLLIAVSYGYAASLYFNNSISFLVLAPFVFNLGFNLLFTPIQFGLKNNALATLDILLVLATLIWAMRSIYPYAAWVSLINIPYLLWVSFAATLQINITFLNRK